MLARMWRNRNPLALLVGMQTGAAPLENSVEVPQKIKNRTTLWPSNSTARNLPKGIRSADAQGHMYPNVYSSTFNNSQIMEEPKCPSTDKWIKKMWFIYTMDYYLAMRKNEIWPFAAMWMELEGIRLSEISQRQIRYIITHMWILGNLTEYHGGQEDRKSVV